MAKQNDIVRLSTLVANLLDLDEKEVAQKLKPLSQELIKTIKGSNNIVKDLPNILK